jgi:hypothetical protein
MQSSSTKDAVEKLEKYRPLVDRRPGVFGKGSHRQSPEKLFMFIRLGVRGRDLYAEDREADLYAAVDVAVKIDSNCGETQPPRRKKTVAARLRNGSDWRG